jgi:TonB-dependent receptor-like protein
VFAAVFALVLALAQFGAANTGELRLVVTDPSGLPLVSAVELVSEANQVRQSLATGPDGMVVVRRLPFGAYRVAVARDGFASVTALVEIRSALPTEHRVTLTLAPVQTQVTVTADDTLVDFQQTATTHRIGADTVQRRSTALPGRSLPDLVNTQPGWLLEANGILHPRGSEYQTQFVIDGLPLTDNRSPAFAPEIDADEVHAMNILTGGYPAEYGRKLGGVVEVVTSGDARRGFHGSLGGSIGSFSTKGGDAIGEYAWPRATMSVSAGVATTDRYLDPPVEENFTNHGTTSNVALHLERDLSDADRLGLIVRRGAARFLVPNELVQEDAGQRQDRNSRETTAQFSYQRTFGAPLLFDVRGMGRSVSAALWSNPQSTPIVAEQDRGFREFYFKTAISGHAGAHEWKAGGDLSLGRVRERFAYRITDGDVFDRETPATFSFDDRATDREHALFVQDRIRRGRMTVNAGLRWDWYRLVVTDHALSPRLGAAWSWPAADLVVRGSYDRAFQTPASENLLLASSPEVDVLSGTALRLPVRPSLGHFYEAGLSKGFGGRARMDAGYFERRMNNFADDDLLLNTGIGFPIAFRHAVIRGAETTFRVAQGKRLSGSLSYAWMKGVGDLPIAGGLFLGEDASLLSSSDTFAISQDQRHTLRGRAGYQLSASAWVALSGAYGSGLPFEFEGEAAEAATQFEDRILSHVDFASGRVKPTATLDASGGFVVAKASRRRLNIQADVRNLTNRLNVINFAGLFSGTALAAPRSVSVRLRADF